MVCHEKAMVGYHHFLGSQLSNGMKAHLMGYIRQGLSLAQVMAHHKTYVKEKALQNVHVTRDTFILHSNVKNLAKKRADELWQKHSKEPITIKMWVMENFEPTFYYVEHALMDFNCTSQDDTPFILGIQTLWQLKMMSKFGSHSSISFEATFGTNQSRVSVFLST